MRRWEHVSSLLYAFGLLWLIGGLLTLRVHVKDEGVAGTAVRSGALFAGMALFIMALIEGLDHMALRVVQDGIGAGADTDQVALALLSTKLGITFFVWPIFYAGIAMAAFGMARLLTASGYRAISSITALLAAITAVLIVLVEHLEANNFWQAVGVIMGVVLLIWLLATAHAMYKEKIPLRHGLGTGGNRNQHRTWRHRASLTGCACGAVATSSLPVASRAHEGR